MMSTGQNQGADRSTTVLVLTVAIHLVVAVVLSISDQALRPLQVLVLDGPLVDALLLSWVVLVLLRNPFPGLAPGTGPLHRWRHRRTLVVGIRVTTLLLSLVFLSAGLRLIDGFAGVPGLQYLLVGAIALGCVGLLARERSVVSVSKVELIVAVPFTFALITGTFLAGDPSLSTFGWVIAGVAAAATATGIGVAAGVPIRPPAPFDDPLKLVLGGGATIIAITLPDLNLTTSVVLALLVMPAIITVVEVAGLVRSGTVGGRDVGVPVHEVLREPTSPLERDLRRIKGTYRRIRSRELVDSGERPMPEMLSHELAEHLKVALQLQVGSQARGGEDLPDLVDGEVEVARITYTQTAHGEVVSLRAIRSGDDRLSLRMVDEYSTDFELPFNEVDASISAEQVAELFLTATPSPTDVGAFSVLSDVIPDIHRAFGRSRVLDEQIAAPSGIGAAIRGWFAASVMGAASAARRSIDFRGYSITYEARFYGFGVVLARSIVNGLFPALAPALWALWIPVPALAVRRIRTIGSATIRADAPRLAFAAAVAGVMGLVVLDLPIWFGVATIGPSILMLYLMFRQGPTEREFRATDWEAES